MKIAASNYICNKIKKGRFNEWKDKGHFIAIYFVVKYIYSM